MRVEYFLDCLDFTGKMNFLALSDWIDTTTIVIDFKNMTYSIAPEKRKFIRDLITDIAHTSQVEGKVKAKKLAEVLGKNPLDGRHRLTWSWISETRGDMTIETPFEMAAVSW